MAAASEKLLKDAREGRGPDSAERIQRSNQAADLVVNLSKKILAMQQQVEKQKAESEQSRS